MADMAKAGSSAALKMRQTTGAERRRWEKGLKGEKVTARRLWRIKWSRRLFHGEHSIVFHDLHPIGYPRNIDHVVINRRGVFIVDSKNKRDLFAPMGGTWWYGTRNETHASELTQKTEWQLDDIRAAVGPDVPLSLTWSLLKFRATPVRIGKVTLAQVRDLKSILTSGPSVLSDSDIREIAQRIERSFV